MREYAVSVFVISAVAAILSQLAYKGRSDPSRFAISVIVLYVVIAPLGSVLGELDIDSIFSPTLNLPSEQGYEQIAADAFADGIAKAVAEEFSLERENLRVELRGFDFENMRAEKIRVILSGRAALADYKEIERYVDRLGTGDCECEIEIR